MPKKTKEEIEQHFKNKGKEEFDIKVSSQALTILSQLDDFDFDDFAEWWVKNRALIGGAHLLDYLSFKERSGR